MDDLSFPLFLRINRIRNRVGKRRCREREKMREREGEEEEEDETDHTTKRWKRERGRGTWFKEHTRREAIALCDAHR